MSRSSVIAGELLALLVDGLLLERGPWASVRWPARTAVRTRALGLVEPPAARSGSGR